jgi:hypothetical protein
MTNQNMSDGASPAAMNAYLSRDRLAIAGAGQPAWSGS